MAKLLIADDNKDISDIVKKYALKEGYEIDSAIDGKEAFRLFKENTYDLVILDIMMPYIDGIELCKKIRDISYIPIILLTAKGDEYDRIMGLDMGADDYIVKPFSPPELMARVRAHLRRLNSLPKENVNKENGAIITHDNLYLNLDSYTAKINNEELSLTKREFELLYTLASNPNKVFTRDILLDNLWGYDYDGDLRTVDTQIKRLRQKLPRDVKSFEIETIRGIGYKFKKE